MASPSYFGKLVTFTSASRKNSLIAFGLFSPNDAAWLANIAGIPAQNAYTSAVIPYAAALTIDTSTADVISVTLTGNVTSFILNYGGSAVIPSGQRVWIRLIQDATGSRTVTLPSNLITDQSFAVDPGVQRSTVLPIEWNGTNWIFFSEPFSVPSA